jgi:hypothetical protein
MPHKIIHLVDHHLLFIVTWGRMTPEELHTYDESIIAIMDAATVPHLHAIYDYSQAEAMPSLKELAALQGGRHPKVGWSIFVGVPSQFLKFLITVTVQVMRARMKVFDTYDDALSFMQQADPTLPNLKQFDLALLSKQAQQSL